MAQLTLHNLLKPSKLGYTAEVLTFLFQNGSCKTEALVSREAAIEPVLQCHLTCPWNVPEYFCKDRA